MRKLITCLAFALAGGAALATGASAQEAPKESPAAINNKVVLLCDEGDRKGTWDDRWEIGGGRLTFMREDKEAGSAAVQTWPDYYRSELDNAEVWINRYTLRAFVAERVDGKLSVTRMLDCHLLDRKI
jgi:hypothetical protein